MKNKVLYFVAGSLLVSPGVNLAQGFDEEILVTATKRATNLLETPIAITALDQDQLTIANVIDLSNLHQLVPSLQVRDSGTDGQGSVEINLRGIGNSTFIETGEPNVAFNIDGVYTARPQAALQMLYDVERIEVTRGPQGTLSGRNASVGAIDVITAKPDFNGFYSSIEWEVSNEKGMALRSMINLPANDTLALRFNYVKQQRNSPYTFIRDDEILRSGVSRLTQKQDYREEFGNPLDRGPGSPGSRDNEALRLSAIVKPTEALNWHLVFENYKDQAPGAPLHAECDRLPCARDYTPEQIQALNSSVWSTVASDPARSDLLIRNYRSKLEYDIPDFAKLRYTLGVSDFEQNILQDLDGGAGIQLVFLDQPWKNNAESHEVTLLSDDDQTVRWVVGYFQFKERTDRTLGIDFPEFGYKFFAQPDIVAESNAFYADVTADINSKLELFAGIRLTEDKRFNNGGGLFGNGACAVPFSHDTFELIRGNVDGDPNTGFILKDGRQSGRDCQFQDVSNASSDDYNDFRLGANYQLSEDIMLYASAATGHKAGVYPTEVLNVRTGELEIFPVKTEENLSTEIGIKGTFLSGRLILAANYFVMDYDDKQESLVKDFGDVGCDFDFDGVYDDLTLGCGDLSTAAGQALLAGAIARGYGTADGFIDNPAPSSSNFNEFTTINIEGVEVRGIEVEFDWAVSDNGQLQGFFSWIDAEFGEFPLDSSIGCDIRVCVRNVNQAGNEPKSTPRFTLNLTYSHRFHLASGSGLVSSVNAYYRSQYHLTNENLSGAPAASFGLSSGESNLFSDEQEASTVVNVNLAFISTDEQYSVELFATNLFNEEVRSHERTDSGNVPLFVYEPPREYGVRLRTYFN